MTGSISPFLSQNVQLFTLLFLALTIYLAYLAFTFPNTNDMTIVTVALTFEKDIYLGRSKALHMASEQVRVMN